ncbi:hypothetical protein PI125_g23513 [Phytophthora idaei]|nr:hypothetical protein PI125_g23513 [Phytophthora idaei]KAG3162260.1 hypothetical protein PI126_g6064 [Phytophthora idaei]
MRTFLTILVVATTLRASCEPIVLATDSDQIQLPQLNKDTRLLRVGKSTDDINNEARSWVHIGGFNRTKEEAKSWLQKWIYDGENMESVGKKLGLYNLPENEMLNHINFEALRKFVRIDFYQRTGYKLPKGYALKKITG